MLIWIRPLVAVGLLALAAPAVAADFGDRDRLTDLLTMDEQAPLADAEEALAEQRDLLDTAEAQRDAAQDAVSEAEALAAEAQQAAEAAGEALAQAVADGVTGEELAALEAAALDAMNAASGAADAVGEARDDLDAAQSSLDGAQSRYDAASDAVDVIVGEIEGTAEFVEELDSKRARALHRSLQNAVASGLLPLDIDLDVLRRILDEDLGNGEIQQLTHAFEMEARFDRQAARFEDKGDRFERQADRARDKADASRARFLCRIGEADCGGDGYDDDGDAADRPRREKPRDAVDVAWAGAPGRDKARPDRDVIDDARDRARNAVGEAMREVARGNARGQARRAAVEAAREAVEDVREDNRGRGLAKGQNR